jgi:hypothetical protein
MRRLSLMPLLFIFLFGLSCSESPEPAPSGECRLTKIIYEGRDRYEQDFKYDSNGLLVGVTLPYIGTNCREELSYDGQGRLISRRKLCKDLLQFEMQYSYLTSNVLEGHYVRHYDGQEKTLMLYYNSQNQLDSTILTEDDHVVVSRFEYDNGNLTSGIQVTMPCCKIYETVHPSYDNGINPYTLLKKAANNFGFETFEDFFPSPGGVSTKNNLLKREVLWLARLGPDDPRIVEEEIRQYERIYDYYPGDIYPKKVRFSTNGVVESGEMTFIYDACK